MSNYDCKGCKHRTNHTDEGFKFCSGCDRSYLGADSGYHADRYEKEVAEMSMTESEAKFWLDKLHGNILRDKFVETCTEYEIIALIESKIAWMELEQYRAIGKVEEVQWMISTYNDMIHDFSDDMLALLEYRSIGTVSEFQQLKEKATAKKPTDVRYFGEAGYYIGLCPTCKSGNNSEYEYCGDCGQKLQWFERSEGEE